MAETNPLLGQLAFEFQRLSEREQNERKKHVLRVENILLRFERLLSAGPEGKNRK